MSLLLMGYAELVVWRCSKLNINLRFKLLGSTAGASFFWRCELEARTNNS